MAKSINETTININGSSIQLRTDMSEEKLMKLADYVDGKMRQLDPKGVLPHSKVSMLASLTIAGELLEERKRSVESQHDLLKRLEHLHKLLDEALGGS